MELALERTVAVCRQTRLVECRTGKKRISGAPLFTLVTFDFHEGKQHNIDDVCVEVC